MDSPTEIIALVDAMALHIDARRWSELKALFAPQVRLDYTSLWGGAPANVAVDDLMTAWRRFVTQLSATQHLVTNHRIELVGDAAKVETQALATHVLAHSESPDDRLWVVGGRYEFELRKIDGRWRIAALAFRFAWEHGRRDLLTPP